jgi:hypothetical protein
MFQFDTQRNEKPQSSEGSRPRFKLPPEIENLLPTEYAGKPAEYEKEAWNGNTKVIILHYFIDKGWYLVADKVDRPGNVPGRFVSPNDLRKVDEKTH